MIPPTRWPPRIASPFHSLPRRSASVIASTNRQAEKHSESDRDEAEENASERLCEERPQGVAAAAGLAAGTDGGQHRQPADQAINHAARRVAEPRHHLQRVLRGHV